MASSHHPQPGAVIGGKYRFVRLLGEGGMGAVYEAENTLTHKRVALKWMHPEVAKDPEASTRLIREAQASARIRHPNVVDVYDVGREGDAIFLVMEYLEGEPLSAMLGRGGMSIPQLIATLLPAMRGVAAAHKHGVVHRDIKPDNIFLSHHPDNPLPVPKVLDFGISKLESRGVEQLSLTRTGSTMGTPMYMSLEQLSGAKDVDARTDVYAFGVILYAALTGRPPFEAASFPELAIKIATTDPVPLKQLRPDIPTALEKLVLWAMARDREQRVPSMNALIQELEPFASPHSFRNQMTVGDNSLPRMGSPSLGLEPGKQGDSQGPQSTPIAATVAPLTVGQVPRRGVRLGIIGVTVVLLVATLLVFRSSAGLLRSNAPRPPATSTVRVVEATPLAVPSVQAPSAPAARAPEPSESEQPLTPARAEPPHARDAKRTRPVKPRPRVVDHAEVRLDPLLPSMKPLPSDGLNVGASSPEPSEASPKVRRTAQDFRVGNPPSSDDF